MSRTSQITWILFKTLLFTIFVPGAVGVLIPYELAGATDLHIVKTAPTRLFVSSLLFFVGAAIYLWCAWDFSVKGLGTPAPIGAPKYLVVNGLYRFVRNPMYVGVACVILGQAIAWSSVAILYYMAFFLACVNLFIVFYEEPHLRKIFGEQYEDYCRNVPRWIPRLKPYRPPAT